MSRTTGTTKTTVQTSNTLHTVIQGTNVGMLKETTGIAVRVGTTGVKGIFEGSSFVFEGGNELVEVEVIERRQRWSFRFLLHRYRSGGGLRSGSLQARVRRLGFGIIKMTLVSCQWTTQLLFYWAFFAAAFSGAVATAAGRTVLSDQRRSCVEGVVVCTVICDFVG